MPYNSVEMVVKKNILYHSNAKVLNIYYICFSQLSTFYKNGGFMALPSELFSATNIAGVAVASAAVAVATNTVGNIFEKLNIKYTAMFFSLLIAYIVVSMNHSENWYDWVLAFFNACLLYCSALGINQSVVSYSGQTNQHRGEHEENYQPEIRARNPAETISLAKTRSFFRTWL